MRIDKKHLQLSFYNMKNWLKNKVADKKGSLLWELMLSLGILFMFIYTATTFVAAFAQYEDLSYVTKTIARQMEVSGECDTNDANNMVKELLGENTPLENVKVKIEVPESTLYSVSNPKLQLKERFILTISADYKWHIIAPENGALFGDEGITIPLGTKVSGMSEVYWKA